MFAENFELSQTNGMRTIGALKSSNNTQDPQFDVAHYEQNLNKNSIEQNLPIPPPTISELMQSIVVYVEVRTGEDNRSSGVKKVIAALGAHVNDKLLRNTTHVIFKDGLLSTYKKAKNWNIPIVSILWIEACKEQRKICDPKEYSISNVDRYENPELYEKMKRFKSMQPGSECNKRLRNKTTISKLDNKGTIIKSIVITNGISSSEQITNQQITPKFGDPLNIVRKESNEFFESPATILLRKMSSASNSSAAFLTPGTNILCCNSQNTVEVVNSYSGTAKELFADTVEQNYSTPTSNFTKIVQEEELKEPLKQVTSSQDSDISIENNNKNVVNTDVYSENQDTHIYNTNNREDETYIHKKKNNECENSTSDILTNNKDSIKNDNTKETKSTRRSSMQITRNMRVTTTTNINTVREQKPNGIIGNQNLKRISKRKTTILNKTIETSNIEKTMISKKNKQNPMKRRTVYTPQNMEETFSLDTLERKKPITDEGICTNQVSVKAKDEDIQDISKKKSDLLTEDSKCNINTTNDSKLNTSEFTNTISILQENTLNEIMNDELKQSSIDNLDREKLSNTNIFIETSTPFSAVRKSGSRRTFYDLTMDLISHRIQSINKTTRKSIFGRNLLSESKKYENIENEVYELNKSATTPNLPSQLLRSKLESQSNENVSTVQCNILELNKNESTTTPVTTKKRKLFVPQNLEANLTPISNGPTKNVCTHKRRKTVNNVSHEPKKQIEKSTKLEQLPKIKKTEESLKHLSSKKKEVQDVKQTELSTKVKDVSITKETKIEKLPTITPTQTSESTSKPKLNYFLVYTNMHKLQIKEIQEAIKKLGKFHIENSVSDTTTHVVTLEPRRTLNLLRALARGLWILEYQWITESLKSGKWLLEEPYEIKDFSRAVVICRSERQAFGASYCCELFNHIGAFYISSRCGPISRENLKELILLCGGKISTNRRHAKYILGDANKSFDEKFYVTPYWILDSITHMQLQKINKYSIPAEIIKPTQTANQTLTPLEKEVSHMQNSSKAKKFEVSSAMRYA